MCFFGAEMMRELFLGYVLEKVQSKVK